MSGIDWTATLKAERGTPIYARCDVCGRKDATVVALVLIRDYDPDAPMPELPQEPIESRRCPTMCAGCLDDEPSAEDLARQVIG